MATGQSHWENQEGNQEAFSSIIMLTCSKTYTAGRLSVNRRFKRTSRLRLIVADKWEKVSTGVVRLTSDLTGFHTRVDP